MRLFLGVDGGQSGTAAVIGDETGRVLGQGEAGPCNHAGAVEGRAKLEGAVLTSLQLACQGAGLDPDTVRFAVACFGMSGGPEDKQEILAAILRTGRLLVTTDAVTALAGATAHGQGIVTIAGTGSIAFGRNSAGASARAGGWGYVFGDEGGAFDLVRQSLRAALRMEEGWGPPTSLRAALLQATGAPSANHALHLFYTDPWPRSRIATLAPLVDAAALGADGVALEIVNRAAIDLAMLAASVRGQLWQPGEPVDVAYIGGVFESLTLRERFRMLVEMETGSRCGPPLHGPAEGALLEAYRAAGLDPALSR
ncbi:MAG: BadF/BadG/BcrA/BcrD ATPase family protein [Candidatus Sulfopaludibacter sp.]|nr:BadF/BadG/BcrA/BcrD ATPase family protein [Candidatus Sulfopaludibacter sp.]